MAEIRTSTPLTSERGIHRLVDVRMGVVGAAFMATVVFAINAPHGYTGATTAALKQGAYTFCAGGFIMRTCENLAVGLSRRTLALLLAVAVPATISIGLTFLIHQMKGTPAPLHSTIPTMLLAPPSFAVWGWRKRRAADGVAKQTTAATSEGHDRWRAA